MAQNRVNKLVGEHIARRVKNHQKFIKAYHCTLKTYNDVLAESETSEGVDTYWAFEAFQLATDELLRSSLTLYPRAEREKLEEECFGENKNLSIIYEAIKAALLITDGKEEREVNIEAVKEKEKNIRHIIEKSLKYNFIVHDADGTLSASVREIVDVIAESLLHNPNFSFDLSVRMNKKEQ